MIPKLDNWSVECAATANYMALLLHVTENQGAKIGFPFMEKVLLTCGFSPNNLHLLKQ